MLSSFAREEEHDARSRSPPPNHRRHFVIFIAKTKRSEFCRQSRFDRCAMHKNKKKKNNTRREKRKVR